MFGVSQATVSRRWDLLRPVIGEVLAEVVPDPRQVVGRGTVLSTARSARPGTGPTYRTCSPPRPATPA